MQTPPIGQERRDVEIKSRKPDSCPIAINVYVAREDWIRKYIEGRGEGAGCFGKGRRKYGDHYTSFVPSHDSRDSLPLWQLPHLRLRVQGPVEETLEIGNTSPL